LAVVVFFRHQKLCGFIGLPFGHLDGGSGLPEIELDLCM